MQVKLEIYDFQAMFRDISEYKFHKNFNMRKLECLEYCKALFAWSYMQN